VYVSFFFLQTLGEHGAANNSFSTALTLHRQLPEGWLSWGTFNDAMYSSSGDKAYLESTAACYLQAIRFGSVRGRGMLPRLLHLLSFENDGGEVRPPFLPQTLGTHFTLHHHNQPTTPSCAPPAHITSATLSVSAQNRLSSSFCCLSVFHFPRYT
jgi:hypothetical protein